MTLTVGRVLLILAVIAFVVACFAGGVFGLSVIEVVALGLALFAAGHLVP